MRSSTIVLAVGLFATPLAMLASPDNTASAAAPSFPLATSTDTVNGHVLTDAPVPNSPPAGLPAVDRVAGEGSRTLDAGPTNSTPFSGSPSGTLSSGGTQVSSADRVNAPADDSGVVPNLGR